MCRFKKSEIWIWSSRILPGVDHRALKPMPLFLDLTKHCTDLCNTNVTHHTKVDRYLKSFVLLKLLPCIHTQMLHFWVIGFCQSLLVLFWTLLNANQGCQGNDFYHKLKSHYGVCRFFHLHRIINLAASVKPDFLLLFVGRMEKELILLPWHVWAAACSLPQKGHLLFMWRVVVSCFILFWGGLQAVARACRGRRINSFPSVWQIRKENLDKFK